MLENEGKIIKISGPVLDIRFEAGNEPPAKNLLVTQGGAHMEVSSHVAPGIVRCIALEATEGLCCGTTVKDTGKGITVPVGEKVLGRVVDVLGRPIDGFGEINAPEWEIHRDPPEFRNLTPVTEFFETG
ncbi:MAG: F0F1 ATP synthase subunit beta, partial [Clostridiales bacterium]|nr:F0F1 ATP synthase subunit beta [Clostridiales bacterium]